MLLNWRLLKKILKYTFSPVTCISWLNEPKKKGIKLHCNGVILFNQSLKATHILKYNESVKVRLFVHFFSYIYKK
jgi:hypothetical protein